MNDGHIEQKYLFDMPNFGFGFNSKNMRFTFEMVMGNELRRIRLRG